MFDTRRTLSLPSGARACVDEISELERAKAAICARQALLAAQLDDLTPTASDRGTGAQLGLARNESPHRGRRLLSLARALTDLPHTLAALARGEINEHRAEVIAREGHDLPIHLRPTYDEALAADPATLSGLGDTEVQLLAQRQAMRLDEDGAVRRRDRAHARRRVTARRLGDGQAQITGIVADYQAAAIMAALYERAGVELAVGDTHTDGRSRAQLVTDAFVERLTGQVTANATPVSIGLVVSAETLLGDDDEPGEITGSGPVPATVARRLAAASPEQATTIRRLFGWADHLVGMESVSVRYAGLLASYIRTRDQLCRTPYCGARILHIDHVEPLAQGGPTTSHNGNGLCESCNYTKEEPGWRHEVVSAPFTRHEVQITTPTGHQHQSRAPAPPRTTHDGWHQSRPSVWVRAA